MTHHVAASAIAALALLATTGAQAQVYVDPYVASPQVYVAPPVVVGPSVVVAPRPYGYYGYSEGYSPYGYTTVNPYNGRQCTAKPDGYRWCWTP